MIYTYNNSEEYIKEMYNRIGINRPPDLNPVDIMNALGHPLEYVPARSMRIENTIYLDSRLPQNEQWQEFGHELCHLLWHPENQFHCTKEFIALQERQANNFALYACIPTSMLLQLDLGDNQNVAVHRICTLFNVTPEFATERLKRHNAKLYTITY